MEAVFLFGAPFGRPCPDVRVIGIFQRILRIFPFHETFRLNNNLAQFTEHQDMHAGAVAGDGLHDGVDTIEGAAVAEPARGSWAPCVAGWR